MRNPFQPKKTVSAPQPAAVAAPERPAALNCPICHAAMLTHEAWQACPNAHGMLITDRDLERLQNGEGEFLLMPADTRVTQHIELTCPNCQNRMEVTYYKNTKVVIDFCPHCPYNWLDGPEAAKLANS